MSRRALIYCRISSDPKREQAGVERQEADCRALAEQLGWVVMDVLVDNDVSAYSGKKRPAYTRLLHEIEEGRADAVLAWHSDRLYRRLIELEKFADMVNAHHVQVRTVRAGEIDLATPTGRAMARTAAVWAGHEVEHGIERMVSAKKEAAAEGDWRGGSRPFGYEPDGVTIRPSEAREIRQAARRVLAGESLRSIVLDWRDRDLPTPRGGTWSMGGVRYVLLRARNAALIERHGEIIGPAKWKPILKEHQLKALRELFNDPERLTGTVRDRRYLGSGLYLCGTCDDGTRVKIGGSNPKRGAAPSYRCKTDRHLSRVAPPVDEFVGKVIKGILLRPETKLGLWRPGAGDDIGDLQAEAIAIGEEIDGLSRALGRREIKLRAFTIASEQLEKDLAKVNARLAASEGRSPLLGIVDAPDVGAAWDDAKLERKRAVLDVLATVTLLPAPRGRRPGGGYFDTSSILIEPRSTYDVVE